jgi:regulator of PEP synthase PpsR (kinase-PPPase family)
MKKIDIHMLSDATGETVVHMTRACLSQFEGISVREHLWILMRTEHQIDEMMSVIALNPGVVIYTIVDPKLRERIHEGCYRLQIPCVSVLDPVINTLMLYLGKESSNKPGRQYIVDDNYFNKIDAIDFALHHDDGQRLEEIEKADVVLVGISRTSKTPTCLYLAQHTIKAANYPLVPGIDPPEILLNAKNPIFVGLTENPDRLIVLRRHRLGQFDEHNETDYINPERVKDEILWARRLFSKMKWPVIDVTNRSIEETSASILKIYSNIKKNVLMNVQE